MLSNTCRYAVRAVIYLSAGYEGKLKYGIKKISEDLSIPSPFLGKILQKLVKAGILSSNKGPNGGFCLAQDPTEISLFDVIKVIDGGSFFDQCIICDMSCTEKHDNDEHCAIHHGFKSIREEICDLFRNKRISDLLEECELEPGKLRF